MFVSRLLTLTLGLALVFALTPLRIGAQEVAAASSPSTTPEGRRAEQVLARGEYMVRILGCNDCHTPLKNGPEGPESDMSRMLSGHPEELEVSMPDPMPAYPWAGAMSATNTAFAGPWGITFATNLTPDENTGMGIWTEKMFRDAIRRGRHMGVARRIMPPMPWTAYANLTDEDLSAVYAYLRTIPSIHNRVPDYRPPAEAEETLAE